MPTVADIEATTLPSHFVDAIRSVLTSCKVRTHNAMPCRVILFFIFYITWVMIVNYFISLLVCVSVCLCVYIYIICIYTCESLYLYMCVIEYI